MMLEVVNWIEPAGDWRFPRVAVEGSYMASGWDKGERFFHSVQFAPCPEPTMADVRASLKREGFLFDVAYVSVLLWDLWRVAELT